MSAPAITASISPGNGKPIPPAVAAMVSAIKGAFDRPVLCIIQHGDDSDQFSTMEPPLYRRLLKEVLKSVPRTPVSVLLHSPGGDAHTAYRLARLLQSHCGEYHVFVPHYAKSAATLFSLGAKSIVLGSLAELGPLDAQIEHPDQERVGSALEVLQTVERLNSEALQSLDSQMFYLMPRCRKRINELLPIATHFVADQMKPLWEKIDTVQFTQVARILKVGQDYATRLLTRKYGEAKATDIATVLTKKYPDHGFVIDAEESEKIGLHVDIVPDELRELFSPLSISPRDGTILGLADEVKNAPDHKDKEKAASRTSENPQRNQRRTRNRAGQAGQKAELVRDGNGQPTSQGK